MKQVRVGYLMLTLGLVIAIDAQERILGMPVCEKDLLQARRVTHFSQLCEQEIVAACFLEKWIYVKVEVMPTDTVSVCLVTPNPSYVYKSFAIDISRLKKLSNPDAPALSK